MKKVFILVVVAMALLSGTISAQAVSNKVMADYFRHQGAYLTNANYSSGDTLGDQEYWKTMIQTGRWTGENRPEALMGDANIDGKVTAKDALFALYFSVNGNMQTRSIANGFKTSYQQYWNGDFSSAYQNGNLLQKESSQDFWLDYCRFNSPFFADVTKDCVVTAKDALEILKYSVGKAQNFPLGDFTSVTSRFSYYPWPDEYYPGFFEDHLVTVTDEEFCEKYHLPFTVSPTDR